MTGLKIGVLQQMRADFVKVSDMLFCMAKKGDWRDPGPIPYVPLGSGKRGPKPKWYVHDGCVLEGLLRRKDRRFYAYKTTTTFGSAPKTAVQRFFIWKEKNNKEWQEYIDDNDEDIEAIDHWNDFPEWDEDDKKMT